MGRRVVYFIIFRFPFSLVNFHEMNYTYVYLKLLVNMKSSIFAVLFLTPLHDLSLNIPESSFYTEEPGF